MLKQGIETLYDMGELLGTGNSPLYGECLCLFGHKLLCKKERGAWSFETKVITLEKIVSYKCCLPSSNISVKRILTQLFF